MDKLVQFREFEIRWENFEADISEIRCQVGCLKISLINFFIARVCLAAQIADYCILL